MPDPSSTLIISTLEEGSCCSSLKDAVAKTTEAIEIIITVERNLKE
tara:strand:- start:2685 stop:2822 length:138 start_codon:yes stop_codon:yes gene_type:complete